MHYLGKWPTPYWTDKSDAGPVTRLGFTGETRINRHDFGVSWNADMEKGGIVVGNEVIITIDAEANTITLDLSNDELSRRRNAWTAPPYKATRGTLYKYIKNVKSASEGCVTDE